MKTIYKLILISACIPIPNACSEAGDSYSGTGDSVGRGGSMARFTIHDDYLYTVDNSTLKIFDLSNPAEPFYLDRRNKTLDFNIETIFNKDTLLFIGSQDGMYIYSIVAPDNPQPLSYVSHIRSCDPVVASGNYAYVTLNSQNTWCGGNTNALKVYDISDLCNPVEIYTVNLDFPKGLGIDGNKLFVCEAKGGIAVYDVSNPVAPVWKDDLQYINDANGVTPYDVIPVNGLLLTSTDRGLYQFDYKGADFKLKFVSKLPIKE